MISPRLCWRRLGRIGVTEPRDLGHGRRDPGGEGRDLALEVDEEGVRAPTANDLYGMLADARKMEGHGAP